MDRSTAPKTRILFLAADPRDWRRLSLDREYREIETKLRAAEYRDSLEFISKWAVRPDDVLQALNEHRPHIVHFSGHGTATDEILLMNDEEQAKPVTTAALTRLFAAFRGEIRLVVLNACFSKSQAQAIVQHVDCAIGMKRAIADKAAIPFAASLYRAIGFGRSVKEAFDQTVAHLAMEGFSDQDSPELLTRHGVDSAEVRLVPAPDPAGSFLLTADLAEWRKKLLSGSKSLLDWPRTLGAAQAIERPELAALFDRFEAEASSTTLLLGAKGSGKSALLAEIGHRARARDFTVVGIKADRVPRGLETIAQLGEQVFQLSDDLSTVVPTLAARAKILVLIDQLDAVAELMDRHSERLNVLLNLIHQLADVPGVHLVASCREFEHRVDARLSTIDADRIELALPPWEEVARILTSSGFAPDAIGDATRDLLRTPLHLKLFLDIAKPEVAYGSLQTLLEELWKRDVTNRDGPTDRLALLERLAARMSEDEDLWLPASVADDHPEARDLLQAAEILVPGVDSRTLGFRHQTYYDYTLARAFARGSVSLARHVLDRQDGLFVRPVLLNGLGLLRDTARTQYHRELQALLGANPREHIRILVHEFLGEQHDPDDVEAAILLPLLDQEQDGVRVLRVVAGCPGWFARLKVDPRLAGWLPHPPQQAASCLLLLHHAVRFDFECVLVLLHTHWLARPEYDELSFSVLSHLEHWDERSVEIACRLALRTALQLAGVVAIRISEAAPTLAPRFVRSCLERLRESDMQMSDDAHSQSLKSLFQNANAFWELEQIATAAPESFCREIWPWFVVAIRRFAVYPSRLLEYQHDSVTWSCFDRRHPADALPKSLLQATGKFAEEDPDGFAEFLPEIVGSELRVVHQIVAQALIAIAPRIPRAALEYILGDARRLMLGDPDEDQRYSCHLIASVFPHLSEGDRWRLERVLIDYHAYRADVMAESSPKERQQRRRWARGYRLRLLLAIPVELIGDEARSLRDAEKVALPDVANGPRARWGGFVGARMKHEELAKASDAAVINLLDSLADRHTREGDRSDMRFEASRSGGIIQQARELGVLAKTDPIRVLRITERLPTDHRGLVAGEVLCGLAKSSLSTRSLIEFIERLDNSGCGSQDFREGAAHAVAARASPEQPIEVGFLRRLESWLATTAEPALREDSDKSPHDYERDSSILFCIGGVVMLIHGRGSIVRALAAGYSRREPVLFEDMFRIFEERLVYEDHPQVWAETLHSFEVLFDKDLQRAAELYDRAIKKCPACLEHCLAIHTFESLIGTTIPPSILQRWFEMLGSRQNDYCRQAFGELLLVYHARSPDSWSAAEISRRLATPTDFPCLRGLAHAAAHGWKEPGVRDIATDILCAATSRDDSVLHQIVAHVLPPPREERFVIDDHAKRIIDATCQNEAALIHAAANICENLAPLTATQPGYVRDVISRIVQVAEANPGDFSKALADAADALTNIAITLHRQATYREDGLQLFERLLALNLRETKAALELLDRRPLRSWLTMQPWRRPRRRRR
jgi:SpoVK/Ycf46/Vps4 family AAA+-type ATPase